MNLVEIKNDQPVTTSLQVAENFEKRHTHVLEAIEKKLHSAENSAQYKNMFLEGSYKDSSGKENKLYYMNKNGWTFIVMGFNGKKADRFKLQYIEQFDRMEEYIKSNVSIDSTLSIESETKRMNAEARLKNANSRLAKTFVELSKDATTEVNKALLQSKAVEVLTGEKLLEMPTLKEKLFDCDRIAERLGVLSKSGKSHGTAVSQIIQKHISVGESEFEIVPESVNGWSGSVVKYSESVIGKVENWLKDNNFPTIISGSKKNYHVVYRDLSLANLVSLHN